MAGARLLSAPDRHRIPAPLQIPTKTLKGEKIFSISDKDFPVTPVYFAHVLLTRMGLLKLLICHFTYFHAGGPREISRGPRSRASPPPLFSRFFCWRRRNRSSSDWRRRCRRSRRSRSPPAPALWPGPAGLWCQLQALQGLSGLPPDTLWVFRPDSGPLPRSGRTEPQLVPLHPQPLVDLGVGGLWSKDYPGGLIAVRRPTPRSPPRRGAESTP